MKETESAFSLCSTRNYLGLCHSMLPNLERPLQFKNIPAMPGERVEIL